MRGSTSLVAAAVVGLSLLLPTSAGAADRPDCRSPGEACNDLYVVAHEDDDLLFMSPALRRSIDNEKHKVRTIYLTAGDAEEGSATDRWSAREDGVKAAYASRTTGPPSRHPRAAYTSTTW